MKRSSYQAGDWLARCELHLKSLPGLLKRHGLEDYQTHVDAFLEENYSALDKYAPLLLSYGEDAIPVADIPMRLPRHDSGVCIHIYNAPHMHMYVR